MWRRVLLVLGVVAFLAVSAVLARWLSAEGAERGLVTDLLRQRDGAAVEIVAYDSSTAHALSTTTGTTRVVWRTPGRLPTVQCVRVRRNGSAVTGMSITLLSLSPPIRRTAACPR